jgi:hypothetical protein
MTLPRAAATQSPSSVRRARHQTPVVDFNSLLHTLPEVVSPQRHRPVDATWQTPARTPVRSPTRTPGQRKSERSKSKTAGTGLQTFGLQSSDKYGVAPVFQSPTVKQMSQWMQMPQQAPVVLSGLQGLSPVRHATVVSGWQGEWGEQAASDGWGEESYVTRVLRAPQDNSTQPCDITAIQIRGNRVITLAPGSLRFWDLFLDDSSSSGLFLHAPPVCSSLLDACQYAYCPFFVVLLTSTHSRTCVRAHRWSVPTTSGIL